MISKTNRKSLVFKELEKQIESQTVKPINVFAGKKLSLEPSDNLYGDIAKLAEALRRKGFEKQADELDRKSLYVTADTHLYRAIDEDAEDLINFAHPDKLVEIAPAENKQGVMNNTLTQHDRMMEVVEKQPKVASLLEDVEGILGLKKKASDSEVNQLKGMLNSFFTTHKDIPKFDFVNFFAIGHISIGLIIPGSGNEFIVGLFGLKQKEIQKGKFYGFFEKCAKAGGTDINFDYINQQINLIGSTEWGAKTATDLFRDKFSNAITAANSSLEKWFANIERIINSNDISEMNKLLNNGELEYLLDLRLYKNSSTSEKFKNILNALIKLVGKNDSKNDDVDKFKKEIILEIDNNIKGSNTEENKKFWETKKDAISKANSVQDISNQFSGENINKIINIVRNWLKTVSASLMGSNITKRAELTELQKAQLLGLPASNKPTSVPVQHKTTPVAHKPVAPTSVVPRTPVYNAYKQMETWKGTKHGKDEAASIAPMQELIYNIGIQIDPRFKTDYATGVGNADGVWAKMTHDAIVELKMLLEFKFKTDVNLEPGPEGGFQIPSDYKERSEPFTTEIIKQLADNNIKIIESILNKSDEGKKILANAKAKTQSNQQESDFLDKLPSGKIAEKDFPDYSEQGTNILKKENIDSLQNIIDWLTATALINPKDSPEGVEELKNLDTILKNLWRRAVSSGNQLYRTLVAKLYSEYKNSPYVQNKTVQPAATKPTEDRDVAGDSHTAQVAQGKIFITDPLSIYKLRANGLSPESAGIETLKQFQILRTTDFTNAFGNADSFINNLTINTIHGSNEQLLNFAIRNLGNVSNPPKDANSPAARNLITRYKARISLKIIQDVIEYLNYLDNAYMQDVHAYNVDEKFVIINKRNYEEWLRVLNNATFAVNRYLTNLGF